MTSCVLQCRPEAAEAAHDSLAGGCLNSGCTAGRQQLHTARNEQGAQCSSSNMTVSLKAMLLM